MDRCLFVCEGGEGTRHRAKNAGHGGTVIEIELDDATDAADVRVIQNGAMTTYTGRAAAGIAALITESHLGGRVVTQGEEVMRFALAEAIPRTGAGASDATFSGRVAGQAFHDGRQVIAVSVNGSVDVEGEPVRAVGAYLERTMNPAGASRRA